MCCGVSAASSSAIERLGEFVDLRPLVFNYFNENKDEFSQSQMSLLLRAVYTTAATPQHAQDLLSLLPKELLDKQRKEESKRKKE